MERRFKYFASSLWIIIGVVLVWRGIWVLLDYLSDRFFPELSWETALITVIVGIIMIYIPHHNLKDLDKD